MKKRIKTLSCLVLSLALTLSLALPALAYEDTDPPQWEQFGYSSLEEMLRDFGISEEEYYEYWVQPELEWERQLQERTALAQAWLDAHPEEAAAFDPYTDYYDCGGKGDLFLPMWIHREIPSTRSTLPRKNSVRSCYWIGPCSRLNGRPFLPPTRRRPPPLTPTSILHRTPITPTPTARRRSTCRTGV